MAAGDEIAVTEREVFSHGSLRAEQGKFLGPGAVGTLFTKLGHIIWCRIIAAADTTPDGVFSIYMNSLTEATDEDDSGFVTLADELESGEEYNYLVLGKG